MKPACLVLLLAAAISAHQVCYDPYGCFSDDPPFTDSLVMLPESPEAIKTVFWLYTRLNSDKDSGQKISPVEPKLLDGTNFNPSHNTVFVLHGFLGSPDEYWVKPMVDELLRRKDSNVIVLDMKRGLQLPYHQAVGNARIIGAELTRMVTQLQEKFGDLNLKDIHCIGFGTGAHICGYLGRNLGKTNQSIARISGLDPSAIYFEKRDINRRLDPTDADFVDVIHTDTSILLGIKSLGTPDPMGHLDFYPNGGSHQPGCLTLDGGVTYLAKCNHYRAADYFIESINNKECPSRAYRCKNYDDFAKGLCQKCPSPDCPVQGYNAIDFKGKISGKFYLQTENKKPFCSFHYSIDFYTKSQFLAGIYASPKVIITGDERVSEEITIPRQYFKSGSTDSFLIHSRHRLGHLVKVKVTISTYLQSWALDAVVIRPMWTNEVYTGCFDKTLPDADNEKYLKTGVAANCPKNPKTH